MAVDYDLGTARGKIEIDSSQLGRTSEALRTVGRGMVGLGVLAAAGFVVAVKSAADFEKQISAVAAVSQASGREVNLLREQALNLGSTTVFSAGEIAKAMEALAKAGIPVETMLNGATQATVNLAAAAGDELPGGVERAAEVIANAQKTFNVGADQLEHFADVLVAAAASSTISVDDLATSLRYAGPIAAELGLSLDDLSTILAILGDRGIKGSMAGTSLRGVLLSLTPSSKKAYNALRDLGLITADGTNQFYDLHGNLKPIPEVMDLLSKATAGLSEQEKVAAFNAIFQRRAMNAALILADQGKKGFTDYAKAIGALKASDIAAKKLDNLSGDITILRNSLNSLIIRAGEPFQNMIRGWVQSLTGLVNSLSNLDPQILKTILQILAITGVILIAGGSFLLFMSYAIRMYRTLIILREALLLVSGAAKLLTVSFLTNPIVLIIAALVALGVALYAAYRRSETFRQAFDQLFDHFQPTIEKVFGTIQNFVRLLDDLFGAWREGGIEGKNFGNILDKMGFSSKTVVNALVSIRQGFVAFKNGAIDAFDYFANVILPTLIRFGYTTYHAIVTAIQWIRGTAIPAIVNFGKTVGDIAQDVAGWFNDHVVPALAAFGQFAWAVVRLVIGAFRLLWPVITFLGDVIFAVLRFITSLIDPFVDFIIRAWKYLGDNIIEAVVIAFNFIKGVIEGALKIIQGIFQVFGGILTLNWSQVWEGLKNILGGALQILGQIFSSGLKVLRLLVETALDLIVLAWKTAWDLIPEIWSAAWALFFELLNGAVQLLLSIWRGLASLINAIWDGLWKLVGNILKAAWRGLVETTARNVASLVTKIATLQAKIVAIFANAVNWLLQKGKDIVTGLINGVTQNTLKLLQFVGTIAQKIRDALGNFGHLLYDKGKALIQGLIDGIKKMFGPLKKVADGIGSIVGKVLPGSPVKEGPLKVLNHGYAGKQIIAMLAQGLKDGASVLNREIANTAGLIAGPLALPAGAVGRTGDIINIDISLHGVEGDPRAIKAALTDTDVLRQIMAAAKAGRR